MAGETGVGLSFCLPSVEGHRKRGTSVGASVTLENPRVSCSCICPEATCGPKRTDRQAAGVCAICICAHVSPAFPSASGVLVSTFCSRSAGVVKAAAAAERQGGTRRERGLSQDLDDSSCQVRERVSVSLCLCESCVFWRRE